MIASLSTICSKPYKPKIDDYSNITSYID